jgi:hypothetical protein
MATLKAVMTFLSGVALALVVMTALATCRRAVDEGVPHWPASRSVPHGPELTVRAGEPWKYGTLIGDYLLSIRNAAGAVSWTCDVTSPRAARLCDRSRTWFSGSGTYRADVTLRRDGGGTVVATQPFVVDGSEIAFEIELSFMSEQVEKPLRLAELHVMRLLPSVSGVALEPAWTPTAGRQPLYRLSNHSPLTLYGVGWFANYFGHIEYRAGETWARMRRGGFCGTVDSGKPLLPGQTTGSFEGFFIGDVKQFRPGHYRYVIRYSTVSADFGGVPSDVYRSGRTYTHSSDLHVLVAPFTIAAGA